MSCLQIPEAVLAFSLPYLFAYKTDFSLFHLVIWIYRISSVIRLSFPVQNNPKNLDLSYKTDLDLWVCLGRVKLV